MSTSTPNERLEAMKRAAESSCFLDLLGRAEAWGASRLTLKAYEKDADPPFVDWVTAAAARCQTGEWPKEVYVISGEFCHRHWNKLGYSVLGDGQNVIDFFYEQCRVQGICCTYIDRTPDPEKAPEASSVNAMYDHLFKRSAETGREGIRLYCSDVREECHSICIGNEMHVVDWHGPCDGGADERENTVILTGPGVRDFAKAEFELAIRRLEAWWSLKADHRRLLGWMGRGVVAEEPLVPYLRRRDEDLFIGKTADEIGELFRKGDPRLARAI